MEKTEVWVYTMCKKDAEGKGVKVEKPEFTLTFPTPSDKGKVIWDCLR